MINPWMKVPKTEPNPGIWKPREFHRRKISARKAQRKCNISKTIARVSSGVPTTEKQMKARGHGPSAYCFEVFGALDETLSTSF